MNVTLAMCLLALATGEMTQDPGIDSNAFGRAAAAFSESRFAEARSLYSQACRPVIARSGPNLVDCLLWMGITAARTGDLDEAISMLTAAAIQGPNSPAGASARFHLAQAYLNVDRLPEAKEAASQAVVLARSLLGDAHPDAIRATALHGEILVRSGALKIGELMLRTTLEDAVRLNLPETEIAFLQGKLAIALLQRGAVAEATALRRRNVQLISATVDPRDPMLADALLELARALRLSGDSARAEPLLRRAVYIYEKSRSSDSLELAAAYREQGLEALERRAPVQARLVFERALDIAKTKLPEKDREILRLQYDLARAFIVQGRYFDAEALLVKVVSLTRSRDAESEELAVYLASLASVYGKVKQQQRAIELFEESVQLFERRYRSSSQYRAILLAYATLLKDRDRSKSRQLKLRAKSVVEGNVHHVLQNGLP